MGNYNYQILSWPAQPRSKKRREANITAGGSLPSIGSGGVPDMDLSGYIRIADLIKTTWEEESYEYLDTNVLSSLMVKRFLDQKANSIHDHRNQLLRPAVFVIPKLSPTESGISLDDGEDALWLGSTGSYAEVPSGGGVDTVYDLTIKNGQVTLGIYQPGVEPKSIDLSPLIQSVAAQAWVTSQLASYCNGGSYNSETKNIELKHDSTVLATIDARAFIKDGMVDSVAVVNGYLVITFNTDSGKEPIRIPTSDIFDANAYLPLSAGANKPLTGNLYTRSLVPAITNATIGTAANRYNAVYAGAVEGGANNLALARTLNDVRMVGMLLGNSRLSIGEGYAENNLATYLYGATITFLLGQQKVAKWQMDGNGHLLPASASANVNIGAAAKRVANTYSQNSDTQTLNVSGKSTQAEVEVSSSLAIPTSAPTNPTTGKTYIYIDTTGNYTE